MADSFGEALPGPDAPRRLSKHGAAVHKDAYCVPASVYVCIWMNVCLLKGVFLSKASWLRGYVHATSEAGWNIDAVFCSHFRLYSRGHLDRSAFLTLNINCPVEYDLGRVKEGCL